MGGGSSGSLPSISPTIPSVIEMTPKKSETEKFPVTPVSSEEAKKLIMTPSPSDKPLSNSAPRGPAPALPPLPISAVSMKNEIANDEATLTARFKGQKEMSSRASEGAEEDSVETDGEGVEFEDDEQEDLEEESSETN